MANGLFNLKQVMQAVQQGGWPAQKTPAVEYLVVAGGGAGGGFRTGGGGGAGGLLQGIDPVPNGQTLLVTVGAGGAGNSTADTAGGSGASSVFGSIATTGGGGGGAANSPGQNGVAGGSGGGSGSGGNNTQTVAGQSVANQGNAGGKNYPSGGSDSSGGGGGGAGTVGLNGFSSTTAAGNGGAGIASSINGTVTAYAGGGGGSGYDAGTSVGGVGGGGAGGASPTAGTANTGGGGGAKGNGPGSAANGGSGIVIVSYPDVYAAATATTGSPTVSTSGSGSIVFSSNTQLITYPTNAGYAFGTGDYTVEGWVYINGVQANAVSTIVGATSTGGLIFSLTGTTPTGVAINPYGLGNTVTASYSFSLSTWYHVAVTRSSTVTRIFVNGTQVGTNTTDTTNYAQQPMAIGGILAGGSQNLNGNISNVRLVKGTAVYTANFTAPTAPLTAITNTTMLLNAVSGAQFADGSTLSAVATLSGSPAWNALSPFTGTGYKNRVYTWTTSGSITF